MRTHPDASAEDRTRSGAPDHLVAGRNAVLSALTGGREIDAVYVAAGERQGSLLRICALCRERRIPVKEVAPVKLDYLVPGVTHQGVVASCSPIVYAALDELFARAAERGEPPFLVVSDEIEDPHNLGAIIRSAEAAGAHGIVIPKRRGVQVTPTVLKSAAGACEHVLIAKSDNLNQTLEALKKRGVWVYGADMDGDVWCQTDLTGPIALVIGSEGRGLNRLVKQNCDGVLSLPMRGRTGSLNASVAAGVLLYEIARQRLGIAAR